MTRIWVVAVLCGAALAGCRRAPPPEAVVVSAPVAATLPGTTLSTAGTVPSGATVPAGAGYAPLAAAPSGAITYETIAGTYRGRAQLVRNDGRCPLGENVAFRMRDTSVRFRVNRSVPELVAPVALDGFFMADNGVSVIRGRFLPGRMEFDAGTIPCGYRYVLTKVS